MKVILVGAGLVGAALAQALSSRGAAVTLIEAARPAAGASGASFGWINASFHASPAHFHLRHAAIAAHHRLETALGLTLHRWTGTLWWEESGAGFERMKTDLSTLGYPVEEIGTAEVAALEPALATPPPCALRFPSEGAVDPAPLTEALLAAAAEDGAQIWLGVEVTGLVETGGRVTGVMTAQGRVTADIVILATGCATPALMAPLGLTLPMLHRPGAILRTRAIPQRLSHILVTPDQEIRQDAEGRLLAPCAASHQGDAAEQLAEPPAMLAAETLARLSALLGTELHLDRMSLAHRPVPGDGLPVVGAATEGLALAVMHSGITLAPLVAELLAGEVMGGEASPLLADFRPARLL
jgi:glycine/D-amino acid oxidase-like deaminating enzyme